MPHCRKGKGGIGCRIGEREELGLAAALQKEKRRDWMPHCRKRRGGIGCRIAEREKER